MLQQTRVQAALPYYDRFLERFPDIAALASASEEEVLAHWAGLGYYQRARNLRKAARTITASSAGVFPGTLEEIRKLPGVGRYTAGAIHSIAFNQSQPVVDGNVRRVISRLLGLASAADSVIWRQAEWLLAKEEPADFNQAFMELGALTCTPAQPHCSGCPVRSLCRSGRKGRFPAWRRRSARVPESVETVLLVLACSGRVLLQRQPDDSYIPGAWGLPMLILESPHLPLPAARQLARRILGEVPQMSECASVRHSITHRRIVARVYRAEIRSAPPPVPRDSGCRWHPRAELDRHLTSSLFRKGLAAPATERDQGESSQPGRPRVVPSR